MGILCIVCVEQVVFERKSLGGEYDEALQIINQTKSSTTKDTYKMSDFSVSFS